MNLRVINKDISKADRVLSGKDSVLQSFINSKIKPKLENFSLKVKQKVASTRLARLNKRINSVESSLKTGTGIKVLDKLLASIDKKLKERKEKLEKKFDFILKPLKKLQEFDHYIDDVLKGDVALEDFPLIAKIGVGAVVANVVLDSMIQTSYSGQVIPFNYASGIQWSTAPVDWTSYTTEVSGIKYQRKTAGASVNNVINIRPAKKSTYQGQIGVKEFFRGKKSIGYFAVFSDPYYSIRAFANAIVAYRDSDYFAWARKKVGTTKGSLTIYQMLCIAAPPEDLNNPNNYAKLVFQYSEGKVQPNDQLRIDTDKEQFKYLIRAMARVENGALIDLDYLDRVWEAVFGNGVPPLQQTLRSYPSSFQRSSSKTNRREGVNNVQSTGSNPSNQQHH